MIALPPTDLLGLKELLHREEKRARDACLEVKITAYGYFSFTGDPDMPPRVGFWWSDEPPKVEDDTE